MHVAQHLHLPELCISPAVTTKSSILSRLAELRGFPSMTDLSSLLLVSDAWLCHAVLPAHGNVTSMMYRFTLSAQAAPTSASPDIYTLQKRVLHICPLACRPFKVRALFTTLHVSAEAKRPCAFSQASLRRPHGTPYAITRLDWPADSHTTELARQTA